MARLAQVRAESCAAGICIAFNVSASFKSAASAARAVKSAEEPESARAISAVAASSYGLTSCGIMRSTKRVHS